MKPSFTWQYLNCYKKKNKQSILSTYSTHSTCCSITTDSSAAVDGWGKCHEELHQGED